MANLAIHLSPLRRSPSCLLCWRGGDESGVAGAVEAADNLTGGELFDEEGAEDLVAALAGIIGSRHLSKELI